MVSISKRLNLNKRFSQTHASYHDDIPIFHETWRVKEKQENGYANGGVGGERRELGQRKNKEGKEMKGEMGKVEDEKDKELVRQERKKI